MSTTRRRFTAVLLAGALLGAACSDGGGEKEAAENPQQAFTDAIDALREYEGITLDLSFDAEAEDLAAADLPEDAAEKLLNSSIRMSVKGETPEDVQTEVVLNVDGNEDAAEIRVVDESLYARFEVRELTEAFGGNTADVDMFVQQASAAGLDFAQPIADGEWVGIEGLNDLLEQFTGVQPTADPEQAAAMADRIVSILEQNAEVSSEGTDDVGAHLVVRVPMRETIEELMDAIQSLSGAPEGAFPTDALEEIPDGELPIDTWISDGRIVQLELDFVAIAEELGEEPPEGVDQLALRLGVEEFTEDVEPPSDFTAIDLEEILQGIFGAVPGAFPSSGEDSGGASALMPEREVVLPELGLACTDLQTLSPDEIRTFLEASGMPGAFKQIQQACPELF